MSTIRFLKINKEAENNDYLNYGFEKASVYKFAELIEWGFRNEEIVAWSKLHFMGNDIQKKWIEDLFEECKFHAECGKLREGKESEIIEAYAEPRKLVGKILFKIYDIDWDVDKKKDLKSFPKNLIEIINIEEDEDIDETIGDWLSDKYGYCHNGFKYDIIKEVK